MDVVPTGSTVRKSFFACSESLAFAFSSSSFSFFLSAVPLLGFHDVSPVPDLGMPEREKPPWGAQ